MSELVRAGHIATGKHIRVPQAHVLFHRYRSVWQGFHTNTLQIQAGGVGCAANRHENLIERNAYPLTFMLTVGNLLPFLYTKLGGRMFQPNVHAVCPKLFQHQFRDIGILFRQQALTHFHLRHLTTQPRKRMSQFRANRATAEHQQTVRLFFQLPQVVRGQRLHVFQTRN